MSLWTRLKDLFERRDTVVINPIHPRDPALADLWGYREAYSGVEVNERNAVSWTALASGIRLVSETLAALPVDVIRRSEPRGRQPLPDHPVAQALRFPNPEISAFEFRELMQTLQELWGNCYAEIIWNGGGQVAELWPINPDRVQPFRLPSGMLAYRVTLPVEPFGPGQETAVILAENMLHIRGWSRYGILGERMVQQFKEAIGLGIATELFGAKFFGSGANAGGVLKHPGQLTDEAQERLRKAKEIQASGLSNAHRMMILEEGMEWQQTTIDPDKAQFITTRKFQVVEASRILRIPPHMLFEMERTLASNVENLGIEFVIYSMLARVSRWERRLEMQLLGRKDQARTQVKFNMAGLLRGDTAAQAAFFTAGRQGGWLSANDVREFLDLNPRTDGGGDTYADLPAGVPANAKPQPQGATPNGREN